MNNRDIFSMDLSIEANKTNLPKNLYAIRVLNEDTNEVFDLCIEHDGYLPNISTERERSHFGQYLSNLEYTLIDEYFKQNKIKRPKRCYNIFEVITNEKGHLHSYSKVVD